eukprot:5502864-Prymnesium_polylepis.2
MARQLQMRSQPRARPARNAAACDGVARAKAVARDGVAHVTERHSGTWPSGARDRMAHVAYQHGTYRQHGAARDISARDGTGQVTQSRARTTSGGAGGDSPLWSRRPLRR